MDPPRTRIKMFMPLAETLNAQKTKQQNQTKDHYHLNYDTWIDVKQGILK